MSIFMMNDETINIIADYIYFVSNDSNYSVTTVLENPFAGMKQKDIGTRLHMLNKEAVASSYGFEESDRPYIPMTCGLNFKNFVTGFLVIKAIDCFLYKCCDGDIPDDPIYKYLEELESKIALSIVRKNKYYDIYGWG